MADDDIIKLGADFGDAVNTVLGFSDAVKILNKTLKDTKASSASFDAFGNLLVAKAEAIGSTGEKLKVAIKQVTEAIEGAGGKILRQPTGQIEVKVDISKAQKTLQQLGPELKATLAAYIKLGQVNLDNLDVSKKKIPVPDIKALTAKAVKAPTPEDVRKATSAPLTGIKAGLEAQFGLTPAILSAATQEQIDTYNEKLNKLIRSMKGMEGETQRLQEITAAYVTKTNPLLSSQDEIILKNLRDVAKFSTELGKATQLTSTLRERTAVAQQILAKQIQPLLTDPKIARATQASFSFFKIPQPEVFADVGSPKEVANVKKVSDQIRDLIVNNAEITKTAVSKALKASGDPTAVANLSAPLRQLLDLIKQLDQAYERLGSEALASTIKQEAASKRTVASVGQTRNQIEQDLADQSRRRAIAEQTVSRATSGQVVPKDIPPSAIAALNVYNSNLLSVQNTAARTTLSVQEIGQVFDAVARRDVRGLIGEQQTLYSTIATLNTAYDKLRQKINEVDKADETSAAAELERARKLQENEDKAEARRLQRVAKQIAENAALTKARKDQIDFTTTTLTKADPALGKQFDFKPAFSASKDSLIALNAAMQTLNNQFVKSGASAEQFRVIVARTRESLKPGGAVFTEPLAPEFDKLRKGVIAVDEAMDRASKSGSTAGKSILLSWQGVFRLFQAQVLHTALGQLIGDFRQALTSVGDFQKEIGLIKTLTQELPDTFDQWSESIARVANEFGKSPTEIATAAYDALSAQITSTREDTEEFVRTATQLARTTGSTTPDAIKVLSAAINGFNLSNQQAGDLAQKFFTVVDKGNVRLSDLSTNFGRTTALANNLGVSFEEVSAALIVLTQTGLSSSQAQTQLNAVLSKLTKPTEAFKNAGFGSGEQLVRTKRLSGAFEEMFKEIGKGNVEITDLFNELRGLQGFLTLSADSAAKFSKALDDVNSSAGKAKFKQADIEIGAPAGVEFARQIQVIREVITKDLAGAAVEGINKFTKAFGGLDGIAKSASTTIINAFGRIGDAVNIAKIAVAGILGLRINLYIASFGINSVTSAIVALELVTEAATAKMVALGVASKAAFLAHPAVAIAAGVAAASYGIAYLINRSKELGIEQTKAFEAGKEAAIVNARKITEVYTEQMRKVGEAVKKTIDQQIALFNGWYDNIARNVENAGSVIEDFAKDIKSAMDVSFSGMTDSFREGIGDIEKIKNNAEKAIEDIDKFQRQTILDRERKDYQQRLEAAPDQQKLPIAAQRAQTLQGRAAQLFDIGKTQEGLRLMEEAIGVLDEFRDRFREIEGLQRGIRVDQFVRGIQAQAKSLLPSNFGIELKQSLQALNKAQLESVGQGVLPSDAVGKARDRVNEVAIRQARSLQQANAPQSGVLTARLRVQELLNQTGGDEVVIKRRALAIMQAMFDLASAQRAKEEEIKVNAEQQLEVLRANQRVVQNLFQEFSKLSFLSPKTGKPLDVEERVKVTQRAEDLQNRLNAAIAEEIRVTAAAKGEEPGTDALQKRLELNELFNKFRKNLDEQVTNKEQAASIKAAQTQDTDLRVKQKDSVVKLTEATGTLNTQLAKEVELLTNISTVLKQQIGQMPVMNIPGDPFVAFENFSKVIKEFDTALKAVPADTTAIINAFAKLKPLLNSLPFKDLETKIDASLKDPSQGKRTLTDYLTEMTFAVTKLRRGTEGVSELDQAVKDTQEVINKGGILPKAGDGVVIINDLTKAYIQYTDVFTEKTLLINRQVVDAIKDIDVLKNGIKNLIPEAQKLGESGLPTAAQAAPPLEGKPEIHKDIVAPPVMPSLVPEAKKRLEEQLTPLEVPVTPQGPKIYRYGPGSFNPDEVQGLLSQTTSETGQASSAFSTFSNTAVSSIQTIVSALNSLNEELNTVRQGLGSIGTGSLGKGSFASPSAQVAAMGGWIHFASGGMVPVMTTPGEVFVSPAVARQYSQQLMHYNSGGFARRGTDTQPGYLPSGSFVLNKSAANSMFGNGNKSWYIDQPANLKAIFAEGGGPIGFTPTVSPRAFANINNGSTINKTLNSTLHINVNGGKTNELTAQEIGKALQRQVRLGLLKF